MASIALRSHRGRRVAERAELVVLVLERVAVDAADAEAALARHRRRRPASRRPCPRGCGARPSPAIPVYRSTVAASSIFSNASRGHAGLREDPEAGAGVDEAPRRDLDGEAGHRPLDALEVGAARCRSAGRFRGSSRLLGRSGRLMAGSRSGLSAARDVHSGALVGRALPPDRRHGVVGRRTSPAAATRSAREPRPSRPSARRSRTGNERAMSSRASATVASSPAAIAWTARLPIAVASTGPARTSRPVAPGRQAAQELVVASRRPRCGSPRSVGRRPRRARPPPSA